MSRASGEVARGEGIPIKPVRDIPEAHRSGCSPIGGDAKTPLGPARIEVPVPPPRFDSARHDRGLCRSRALDPLTPPPCRGFRVAPSTCSTCRCSACSAESASRRPCSAVPVGRGLRRRLGPPGALWLDSSLCSSLDRGKSTRTGSLGTQARCGSRRGTFGASTASALGLCAQPAYTRFVRTVTSSAVVDVPSQNQPRRLKKASRIASATSSVPTPTPTNVSQPPMLLTR